jgi:chromosome segregation ATPase
MGLFKSLFGKSDEKPQAELSAEAIGKKIAEHNHEIEQLKRKLPSAGAAEGMEKSAAWTAEMQARIKAANAKGHVEEAMRLEGEIKEAAKKSGRIDKHVEEIKEQILHCEDEIELLERALAKLK